MKKWNPDLYLKYEDERTQPSYDLVSRVDVSSPANIIDIGCGPGNSTRVLRERWPNAHIFGLDSSREMIAKARSGYPRGEWILADAANWKTDIGYDIVFSNAVLQWIPNHEVLLRALFDHVNERGALAVQIPANDGSPLQQAVLKVSSREEWLAPMAGCEKLLTYRNACFYYDQLSAVSRRFAIWHTTYYHVMVDHHGLIDWYAGTGMRPYLERLTSEEQRRLFQKQVLDECRSDYPEQQDGRILFPFKRLFMVAYKE